MLPQIEGVHRLDVVMAVEENVRSALACPGIVADHHGMADGLANARGDPDLREPLGAPFRGLAAILLVAGVGGNRPYPEQREKALQSGIEIRIDAGEDLV